MEDVKLAIGCPIRAREWAAESYIDHISWATVEAGVKDENVTLVFVSHPDDPTNDVLLKAAALYGMRCIFVDDEQEPTATTRDWGDTTRLHTMVRVRNELLKEVRELEPDLFLSLDSDIMIHSKALRCMIRLLETTHRRGQRPVASGHCAYLSEHGTRFPNYAMLTPRGGMRRGEHGGDLPAVDVLMAAKLMTPRAYGVDYEYDKRGEDIGWSLAVRRHGWHLAWTGRVTSKHCMSAGEMNSIDGRCGY